MLVSSASHVEDAGGEEATLSQRGAVSAQVEVAVLVGELADRREHPLNWARVLGPQRAQVSSGSNVRSRSICAQFSAVLSSDPPSTSGSSPVFSLAAIRFHVIAASVRFDRAVAGTRICPASCKSRFSHENPGVELRCSSGHLNWHILNCAPMRSETHRGGRRQLVDHTAGQAALSCRLAGPTTSKPERSSMPAHTFAPEDVAGREHHTVDCGHADHQGVP